MKAFTSIVLSAFLFEQTLAFPYGTEGMSPASPVLQKRARHCGTWKMKCANAAGACNNACYYINCVNNGERRFTNGPSPVDNRIHSGCTTTNGNICSSTPFSQRTWDRIGDDVAAKPLDCDEFPMNAFKQEAYEDGEYRNSLRCINRQENQSMYYINV